MARPQRAKRKKDPIYLRVVKGGFEPASGLYAGMLRSKGYRVGDLVRAELYMPRHGKHHRLVMVTLQKVLDNLDSPMTMEQFLKVVKIKTGLVETLIDSGTGMVYYIPQSIAFDEMEEGDFSAWHKLLCRVIARDYLPGMSPEAVAEIGNMLEEET
jgi:hypothetical protein